VLAVGASRRRGGSAVAGLVGRANGGMVVHLGVVLVAVAFAAASSYASSDELRLEPGRSGTVAGHTVTYLGMNPPADDGQKTTFAARVQVDGDQVYEPALNRFPNATQTIGTPSVRTGVREDVYLTLVAAPEQPGDPAVIGVIIQPLVVWLWIGGGVMALGTVLAAWPGERRRRPIQPASEPALGTPARDPDPPAEVPAPAGMA
ncbi:MAG: heme lyase CcmF/NrfE family subunit, partial [Actinomycetota bacterium]|nr:heme lyase CcmF/NrfE family subunit [Actinomycetota bacterium]